MPLSSSLLLFPGHTLMYIQPLQEEVWGGRPASCVSPALPGALVSFVKGQGNLYLGTK